MAMEKALLAVILLATCGLGSFAGPPPPGTFKLTKLSYMLRPNDYNGEVSVDVALADNTDVMLQWSDLITYADMQYGLPIIGDSQKFGYTNQWYNSDGSYKQGVLQYSPVPHYPAIPLQLTAETSVPHLRYEVNLMLPTSLNTYRPTVRSLRALPEVYATPGPQVHVRRGAEASRKHVLEMSAASGSAVYMTYTEGLPGDLVHPTQTYGISDWEDILEGQNILHVMFGGRLRVSMQSHAESFGMRRLRLQMTVGRGVDEASGQYALHVDGTTDLAASRASLTFEVLEEGLESRFPASPVRLQLSTATEPEGVADYVTWEMGHPDVIYCIGYSYPPPNLLLTKDGWPVGSGTGHNVFMSISADHTSLSFVLQQVDDQYAGKYECVATTNAGEEFSKGIEVEVV